jgi:hypothetical protein
MLERGRSRARARHSSSGASPKGWRGAGCLNPSSRFAAFARRASRRLGMAPGQRHRGTARGGDPGASGLLDGARSWRRRRRRRDEDGGAAPSGAPEVGGSSAKATLEPTSTSPPAASGSDRSRADSRATRRPWPPARRARSGRAASACPCRHGTADSGAHRTCGGKRCRRSRTRHQSSRATPGKRWVWHGRRYRHGHRHWQRRRHWRRSWSRDRWRYWRWRVSTGHWPEATVTRAGGASGLHG